MPVSIVFRNEKGEELTWDEMDANLANLQVAVDGKKDNFSVLPVNQGGTGQTSIEGLKDLLGENSIPEIGTYALLRTYSGDEEAFLVRGVSTVFDGGFGVFRVDSADTTSADNGVITLVDAAGRRWKRDYSGSINVRWAGAVGNGAINDTDAFARVGALITALSGGNILIPAGTYIVGKQTFAGANGLGYAYRAADILKIQNCTKPVIIESQGAVLKIADGLKFGSFDPVTGLANSPALPNTNQNYGADVGVVIDLENNSGGVSIRGDLEINGNLTNLVVGGQWGDTGYQRIAYGIREYTSKTFYAENVYTHHHGTDGIICGYVGAVEKGPRRQKTLINITSEYNARQGFSWIGGIGLTAINCKFNRSGKAVNTGLGGVLFSAPGAGIDIEAESVCRDGVFINCESVNNTNTALVADTGDSANVRFIGCTFAGTVWPKKPGFKFIDCKIYGNLTNLYGSDSPVDANVFEDCFISDEAYDDYTVPVSLGSNIFSTVMTSPVYFTRSTINATRQRPGRMDSFVLDNCRINLSFPGTTAVNNQDYVININAAKLIDTAIDSNITTNAPSNGYFISNASSAKTRGVNTLTNTAGIVRWDTWSAGGGGFIGVLGQAGSQSSAKNGQNALSLFPNGYSNQFYGTLDVYAGSAAPTSGTYKRGDRVINQSPTVGQPKGWICTVAGTPGTWVSEGNL